MTDYLIDDDLGLEDVPVQDLDRANWVLGKLREARAIRDEEVALHKRDMDRLSILVAAAEKRCAHVENHYGAQLNSFHTAVLRDQPARKTIDLGNGTLKARQGQPSWTFDAQFVEWAQAAGRDDLVRVKVEADKAAAKKALVWKDDIVATADGEQVPGVAVQPGAVTFQQDTPS